MICPRYLNVQTFSKTAFLRVTSPKLKFSKILVLMNMLAFYVKLNAVWFRKALIFWDQLLQSPFCGCCHDDVICINKWLIVELSLHPILSSFKTWDRNKSKIDKTKEFPPDLRHYYTRRGSRISNRDASIPFWKQILIRILKF